nr:MAG TPA: hypothetical protein [Caudoviricetes sp.]
MNFVGSCRRTAASSLQIHRWREQGKTIDHPLYFILHD